MIAEGGHAALWLAAVFALLAAIGDRLKLDLRVPAVAVAAALALAALLALLWCFQVADFSVVLVDDHVHRLQPPLARLAALLNTPPGWLLLTATLAGIAALAVPRMPAVLSALLIATLAFHPFSRQPLAPPEGRALTLPADLGGALLQPTLIAVAAVLFVAVVLGGPLGRPPRWMLLSGAAALAFGAVGVLLVSMLSVEAVAVLRPGERLRLHGHDAQLIALAPKAGPGFTAVEATLAVDGGRLTPQARTVVYDTREIAIPDSRRVGLGRIETALGPAVGTGRAVRLCWSPL